MRSYHARLLGFVVLGTVLMALITPCAEGAGGGGVDGDVGYDGSDPYSGAYSDSGSYASYPNRVGTKATQKVQEG